MVILTANFDAVAQPAKTFITFTEPGWVPYPISTLPAPTVPDLTDPYPTVTPTSPLEVVADKDAAGNPGPLNRDSVQVENRTDELRRLVTVLTRTFNLLPDRFLDRDGAQTPAETSGVVYMRGDLDVGAFKIIKLSDGVAAQDLVTKSQLDAVERDWQDNVEQIADNSILRRDGTLAMQNPLSMDPIAAAPTNRIINLGVPTLGGGMERKTDLDAFETDFLADYLDILGTKIMTGDLDMRETPVSTPNKIVNVGTPTADADGANKAYVDALLISGGGIGVPIGAIMAFMGKTVPSGWHLCDGRSLNRSNFSQLFAVVGVTYGSDTGQTFKVPDLRGRAIMAQDNLGGSSANRVTEPEADQLGGVSPFWLQSWALAPDELAIHSHGRPDSYFASGAAGALDGQTVPDAVSTLLTTPRVTDATGSTLGHNNTQPTMVCAWIIRG